MNSGIYTFLTDKCKKFGDLTFITDQSDRNISYTEFHEGVSCVAGSLKDYGVGKHTRFSIALPNCAEFLYILFGGIAQGGTAVSLNPSMSHDEFDFRCVDAKVDVLFTSHETYQRIGNILAERKIDCIIVQGLSTDPDILKKPHPAVLDLRFIPHDNNTIADNYSESDGVSFLQYTGGTTGTIKAAMITQANVLSSVRQMSEYLSSRLKEREEIFMVTFPFYHVFSIVFQVLTAMQFGSRIIIYPNVRDLDLMASLMQRIPFTVFVGVHTLYKWMLQHPILSKMNYPSAKVFIAGAEHIQPSTKKKWLEATGHLIVEGYGLTETSALATMSLLDPQENDLDSIGKPLPGTKIMLIDHQSKEILQHDRAGEICIKGPQVVKAYWNKPLENTATFLDGWLKTGDMAIRKANGQYKIVGRKKEMINVSGFNVYPNEVESVLMQYPGVSDCAVAEVSNERSGERVAAFLVASDPIDPELVINYCKERLSAYKVPVQIHFIDSIPKSPVGKTLRRVLSDSVNQ